MSQKGKFGAVETVALICILNTIFMFISIIYNGYKHSEKVVDTDPISVKICPVVYVKEYTEIGTVEYVPKFKCEEQETYDY